ncbi:DNA polymerase III subunit gamma/tau [Magnetovibrio blakemorei]|uniref:DNA polymerase III subunit gamma/tau n=1 Tax=Magnetovibrio blakemorei TaxID=28181 RepID=A0A1E5QC64_9PROT|nr:DNA polymerase III subunit gamma/tau [Magnetovibrio blakemorei]OEJ69273.1 DNA polymerase III subunit gamma/tau [Magnetovibrio blakemorei]
MSNVTKTDAPVEEYRVLARKYRPTDFHTLIGQNALVRTLTNAIQSGRLAHAFMLTGVRGVGKTTTARIIARALNCIGADGQGGETAEPCGVCQNCTAIAEDRHVDVMEMDAASRTGVDDIREIIEGVRYKPVSARYKVYIIDEVHMLSKNAFNALLKTLEEPPEHVKFIFATTEIRKVPVTVLSRCQRFDLRRIDMDTLSAHFKGIVEKEGASVSEGALSLISRAADGSVRDGLSLLDQAIAHTQGEVGEDAVRDMLGLADRARTFDLLDAVMKGDVEVALGILASQYDSGADPAQVLEDMLELVHWLTRIKVTPSAAEAPGVAEMERTRGTEMAGGLSMAALTRAWQMLLKGLSEVRSAPSALQAAEMILVRLMFGLELPSPADALKQLQDAPPPVNAPGFGAAPQGGGGGTSRGGTMSGSAVGTTSGAPTVTHSPTSMLSGHSGRSGGAQTQAEPQVLSVSELQLPDPQTFEHVVELAESLGEMILHANLISNVHLVSFRPGKMEYHPGDHAPGDLAQRLSKMLNDHTGRRWVVTVSNAPGQPTLQQQEQAEIAAEKVNAARDPLVQKVLEAFPGAQIASVKDISAVLEPLTDVIDLIEEEEQSDV